MKKYIHKTVLLQETINSLNIQPNGIYVDATFGRGGHSRLILSRLNKYGKLISIDRDPEAVLEAKNINDHRFTIIHDKFSKIEYYLSKMSLKGKINGILLDLGVSSPQIDNPERGFSFIKNGPLDMRMDNTIGETAAKWLSKATEKEIEYVFKIFGQENYAKIIAKNVFNKNIKNPIRETKNLSDIITSIIPFYKRKKHPATRCFQAIRIYINEELKEINKLLHSSLNLLINQGILSVISFHSLEDKLVKKFFIKYSYNNSILPRFPMTENEIINFNKNKKLLILMKKIYPSLLEINSNPRSRSAILRSAQIIY